MYYEGTRRRDVALVLGIALLLLLIYFFGFKSRTPKSVQAADAALFLCSNQRSVTAIWLPGDEGRMVLRLSHNPKVYLSGTTSVDGARYASSDSRFTFWNKGTEASVTENGKITYADCEMMKFKE